MQENIPLQTDTTSFTSYMGNTKDLYKPNNLYTPEPVLAKFDDTAVQELSKFVDGIRFDTSMNAMNLFTGKGGSDWRNEIDPYYGKIDATTTVPLTETHTMMSDGETWMPKYKNYMAGVDNDSRLAMQQTDSEKFWNPVKRFVQNTSLGVADLAAGVYGIMGAAFTGKLDTLYDNDFSHAIDNMTERNNLQFKNYYTEAQRNQSLGFNNQTWDKVLGGAEFTARMLVGEAAIAAGSVLAAPLTGGTSLAIGGGLLSARIGKAANYLSKSARIADKAVDITQEGSKISKIMGKLMLPEIQAASKGVSASQASRNIFEAYRNTLGTSKEILSKYKTLENINKVRFAVMSPLYEAGFEARHARKEMEEDFYDYFRQKGIDPTAEDVNKFSEKINGAAEAVFIANMAILAPSNLATLGGVVGIQTPLSRFVTSGSKAFNKNILKIGVETGEDGIKRAVKYNLGHRVLGAAIPTAKGMLIEGVWEEGSQGIASNTLKNYVASSYDPKAMRETSNYIDAFGKAYKDQFGTKQGQEEIAIGALIGGIMGGFGGAMQNRNERKLQGTIAKIENQGDAFNEELKKDIEVGLREGSYRTAFLDAMLKHNNRSNIINDNIEEAEKSDDYLGVMKGKQERFISLLQAYKSVGREADFVKMISATIKGMDINVMSESTGISVDKIDAYKQHSINQLEKTAEDYSTIYDAAMKVFKKNPFGADGEITLQDGTKRKASSSDYAAGLAYSAVMSDFNRNVAKDAYNTILNKIANNVSDKALISELGAFGAILNAGKIELDSYKKVSEDLNNIQEKLLKLREQIIKESRTDEEKTRDFEKLAKGHTEYQKLQQQASELNIRKEALWTNMTENFYESMDQNEFGSMIDINNFTERVEKLDEALSKLPSTERQGIESLMEVFNTANRNYRSFAELYEQLSDPNVKFKGANNGAFIFPIGKIVAKTQNKITSEKVKDAYKKMASLNRTSIYEKNEREKESQKIITEENFDSEPTSAILNYMKSKLDNNEDFTAYEQKYYNKHKSKIDSHEVVEQKSDDPINEDVVKNVASVAKRAIVNKLKNFNNGKYTKEQEDKIKEFDDVIARLDGKIQELRDKQSNINVRPDDEVVPQELKDEILSLESEIEELEEKSKNNLKNLGYEIREDGIYHYGEKISDETTQEALDKHILEFKKDFDNKVKPLPKEDYDLYYHIDKKGNITTGTLSQLSNNKNLGKNPKFTQVTEDDIKVGEKSVIVTYTDDEGNIYTEEYHIQQGKGTFSSNLDFGKTDRVNFTKDGIFSEEENEDGVLETSITLRYKKEGNKNRTPIKLTGLIVDKIIFETIYNEFNNRATEQQRSRVAEQVANRKAVATATKKLTAARKNRDTAISDEAESVRLQKDKISSDITSLNVDRAIAEDTRNQYISGERLKYEEEIDGYNKILSKDRKIIRLKNKIEELKSKLMNTEFAKKSSTYTEEDLSKMNPITEDAKQYYHDLYKLLRYQRELISLEKSDTIIPFRNDMSNEEKISWVYNNIDKVEISTIDEAVNIKPPTEEELQEYYRLTRKRNKTADDNKRIETLRDKIFEFELISHIPGMSLQELITLAQQQRDAITLQSNERETSLDDIEQGVEHINTSNVKDKEKSVYNPAVSNLDDYALFGYSKTKDVVVDGGTLVGEEVYTLHNKKPQPIIEKLIRDGWSAAVTVTYRGNKNDIEDVLDLSNYFRYGNAMETNQNGKDSEFKNMGRITIVFKKDGSTFEMSRSTNRDIHKGRVHIKSEGYDNFLTAMGYKIFKQRGVKGNYTMIYEESFDGLWRPVQSDKSYDMTINGETTFVELDLDELNSLTKGSKVTVVYDSRDGYNAILESEGKDLVVNGRMYIYSNGRLVGLLKSPDDKQVKLEKGSWNNLTNFRRAVLRSPNGIETTVNNTFINFPLYQFDSNMKPVSTPVREDKVITYGYVKDGEITVLDKRHENIDIDIDFASGKFLPNDGKLRPIAIFDTNGRKAAFPINLSAVGENEDLSPTVREIFESEDLTSAEKAIEINDILTRVGLNTSENLITPETKNIDNLYAVLEDFRNRVDVTDVNNYRDATSYIDFNNPFSGAKLHLNISGFNTTNEDSDNMIIPEGTIGENIEIQDPNVIDEVNSKIDENQC